MQKTSGENSEISIYSWPHLVQLVQDSDLPKCGSHPTFWGIFVRARLPSLPQKEDTWSLWRCDSFILKRCYLIKIWSWFQVCFPLWQIYIVLCRLLMKYKKIKPQQSSWVDGVLSAPGVDEVQCQHRCTSRGPLHRERNILSLHQFWSAMMIQLRDSNSKLWMQDGNNLLMLAAAGGHYEASENFVDGYCLGLLVFAPKFWDRCSPILTNMF